MKNKFNHWIEAFVQFWFFFDQKENKKWKFLNLNELFRIFHNFSSRYELLFSLMSYWCFRKMVQKTGKFYILQKIFFRISNDWICLFNQLLWLKISEIKTWDLVKLNFNFVSFLGKASFQFLFLSTLRRNMDLKNLAREMEICLNIKITLMHHHGISKPLFKW